MFMYIHNGEQYVFMCSDVWLSVQLTAYGVVSLLLVHRDLGQPGTTSQQLGHDPAAELVLPEHLTFLLGTPINVVLEHTNTEGVLHI